MPLYDFKKYTPCQLTLHAPDAAGAAGNLGATFAGRQRPQPGLAPEPTSGAGDADDRRQSVVCYMHRYQ